MELPDPRVIPKACAACDLYDFEHGLARPVTAQERVTKSRPAQQHISFKVRQTCRNPHHRGPQCRFPYSSFAHGAQTRWHGLNFELKCSCLCKLQRSFV
jgi:hypothetical protein